MGFQDSLASLNWLEKWEMNISTKIMFWKKPGCVSMCSFHPSLVWQSISLGTGPSSSQSRISHLPGFPGSWSKQSCPVSCRSECYGWVGSVSSFLGLLPRIQTFYYPSGSLDDARECVDGHQKRTGFGCILFSLLPMWMEPRHLGFLGP